MLVDRPWGSYEVLASGQGHQVKRLTVLPGARLSLQSHLLRAELWCVVAGTAEATLDGAVSRLGVGDLLRIPVGAVHRLANPDVAETLVVIEVQTGESFSEEDITRYEDDFGRA